MTYGFSAHMYVPEQAEDSISTQLTEIHVQSSLKPLFNPFSIICYIVKMVFAHHSERKRRKQGENIFKEPIIFHIYSMYMSIFGFDTRLSPGVLQKNNIEC